MSYRALLIDPDLCVGCHSCEVACKQENNLPVGVNWIHVTKVGPRWVGGKLRMDFLPIRCMHCGKPPCLDVCPVNAITKRADGVVLLDPTICNGCKRCIEACPFGAVQFNPERSVAEKCTLCVHRIDKGLEPSCMRHCLGRAIHFSNVSEFTKRVQERYAVKSVLT